MVLKDVQGDLAKLRSLGQALSTASDRFTEELKAVEAQLAEARIGLEVELPADLPLFVGDVAHRYADDDRDRVIGTVQEVAFLAYGKPPGRGNWALLVKHYEQRSSHSELNDEYILIRTSPLLESSRELRLAAAEQLPQLLSLLARTAQEKLAAVEKATDTK